ncbi:tetratricopeptide repeat protein [uncultured Algibacter sp.]|uniref:tetratricopeptide repeat protein n=1 Tax=uncultured Algibacter sp. TaxID=298659 RepID=UPI0026371283|nr:tetratricopeptide repeat protein [uncultured Algibacter sp.]
MKKLILTLFVLLPVLTIGQASKIYRKALRSTDSKEKISLLNEVIKLEPKNLDAYFQRGLAKNDSGDYHGAIVDYSKIIVEQPDADTYYNRGNSRYSIKDLTGAKEDYAKAYILDKNFIDALYSLACVRYDLEEYDQAISDFNKVIKAAPAQSKLYTLRASSYKALEKYTEAAKDYSTAILIEPNANNYYNRGVFLMDINYYENANEDLTRSLRLNQNNSFAYFYRGASYLLLGKFTNAITDFSEALKFDTMDFDAHLGLAIAYSKINDIEKAKASFKRANEILSIENDVSSIEPYNNTYWFQNQYYYFNNNIATIAKL